MKQTTHDLKKGWSAVHTITDEANGKEYLDIRGPGGFAVILGDEQVKKLRYIMRIEIPFPKDKK